MKAESSFFVPGIPKAQPRAKSRRNIPGVYNPTTADGWKNQVALACRELETYHMAPVTIHLAFCFVRPKSHFGASGRVRPSAPLFHAQKPDLDNLAKSTLDAMVDAQFINDDKAVVNLFLSKTWGDRSGCFVKVELQGGQSTES